MTNSVTAWHIFLHSINMLRRNRAEVLKVFAAPAMLAIFLVVVVFWQFELETIFQIYSGNGARATGKIFILLFLVVLCNLILIWPVIVWHRFILLEIPVGWVNRVEISGIFSYFFYYIGILILVTVPSLILRYAFAAVGSGLVFSLDGIFDLAISSIIAWLGYRLAPVLPGIALGLEGNGLGAAWKATQPGSMVLFFLAIIFAIFGLIEVGIALMIPEYGYLFLNMAITVVLFFVQISVATTIYGVYVEKREI